MTVTAPPRPPRPSDPVDREEIEALVEALIEEARQRARAPPPDLRGFRALVALVVVAVSTVVDRSTQPDTASPALAARSEWSGRSGDAEDCLHDHPRWPRDRKRRALRTERRRERAAKADPHRRGHAQLVIRRAEARLRGPVSGGSVSVMSVDGSAPRLLATRSAAVLHGRRMGEGSRSCVLCLSRLALGRLRHEHRWERAAEAGAKRVARCSRLVARRAEDRFRELAAPASSEIFVVNADGSGRA